MLGATGVWRNEKCMADATSASSAMHSLLASFLVFCHFSVCCPYPFVTIPGLLSFVTLILTWLAAINCAFFSIPIGDDDDNRDMYVGLWSVESDYAQDYDWYDHSDHICVSWYSMNYISSDDLDAPMKVARAFGLISGILATIAFVLILIPSCVVFDESSRNKYILSLSGMCIFIGIATLLELVSVV